MIFVFKSHLTKQNLNSELLELNLIKTIFANVREFRYEDTVLYSKKYMVILNQHITLTFSKTPLKFSII